LPGLEKTSALHERLTMDRSPRRSRGFSMFKKLPSESTFSRAFGEFARTGLAERAHAALIKWALGDALIGHLSRDATAIEPRERPQPRNKRKARDRREETKRPVSCQRGQTLAGMPGELPTACDWGTKRDAKGYKRGWQGYKPRLDRSIGPIDCGVPISALLSSASPRDSMAAIPLSLMSRKRVTNLYDVMDAGYCSLDLREHCRALGRRSNSNRPMRFATTSAAWPSG
jgi:hypothetical protein